MRLVLVIAPDRVAWAMAPLNNAVRGWLFFSHTNFSFTTQHPVIAVLFFAEFFPE
jgi:hypothetical protein